MTHRTSRAPHTWFRRARIMLWQITLAFGHPAYLAHLECLLRPDHARIAQWVFALERLVRKILIACALKLDLPPPRPSSTARAKRPKRTRTLHLWWPDRPSTWPVRFRLYLARKSRPRRIRVRNPHPRRFLPTIQLAFRLEAVAEVLRDPQRFIHRAARTLTRVRSREVASNSPLDVIKMLLPQPRDPTSLPNRCAEPADSQAGGKAWALIALRWDSG